MEKNRRKGIRKISFLVAVIVLLAIWGTVSTVKLVKTERVLLASRERALTELGTHLDTISVNLDKCIYASTKPMIADISSEVWRASAAAKINLSEITDGKAELSSIYKFLSQVGEYTIALNEKNASSKKIGKKDGETLLKLSEYADNLSEEVNFLISEEQSGTLKFEELKSTLSDDENDNILYLNKELEDTKETFTSYPTLIYDGPFSDNINTKKSTLLEELPEITKEEAQKKASEFLDIKETELYFLNECESNLDCYSFYNADLTVSVTKKGGFVSYMLSSRFAGEKKADEKEAIKAATLFLNEKGYKNVKESYYAVTDGICTINFTYFENDITYYTDLIKVSVALDNCEITAFDATGYLMNHKERKIKENGKYNLKSGEKVLNDNLTVIKSKKAFIPNDFGGEEFVYEYHCKAKNGEEILVYLSPNGEEKEILILLYSDGGILTK